MRLATGLLRPFRGSRRTISGQLLDRARTYSQQRRFRDAGILYEEVIALRRPRVRARLHVQAGHMFKEAGDLPAAEGHYLRALQALPDDADLALQLGHFYKISDRFGRAVEQYRRACALRPDWAEPRRELDQLERQGGLRDLQAADGDDPDRHIVAELLPGPPDEPPAPMSDAIEFRKLGGRRERSRWGLLPLMSGVEAIRGLCFSRAALRTLTLSLDGVVVHSEALRGGVTDALGRTKYVFNIWFDLSSAAPGLHKVAIAITDADGHVRSREEAVLVAPPLNEDDPSGSDAIVTLDPGDPADAVTQVRARPSVVHPHARPPLAGPVRTILVLRTDQMGDVVVSLPAMRRLRALFPAAHIVGLFTSANIDLARTTGLWDELIEIDFPDDVAMRRRFMTRRNQEALRRRLSSYRFDIGLDLATSHMSRPLMLLSGAAFLYGYHDGAWPWLTAGMEGSVHDPKNHLEAAPQSSKVLALIERLGTLKDNDAHVVRRDDLTPERVRPFGVRAGRYVVLHTGARIVFSRWAGYAELARRLLAETDFHVLLMADDPGGSASIDRSLSDSPRFSVIDRRLPFDDFDALLSHCAVFVGNDSGPKHLASLRGVPVVSIHSARINWNEWGQEHGGVIVSRRVPCAGCAIYHDVDECGKQFACIADIKPAEVFEAVLAVIAHDDKPEPRSRIEASSANPAEAG